MVLRVARKTEAAKGVEGRFQKRRSDAGVICTHILTPNVERDVARLRHLDTTYEISDLVAVIL